MSLSNYVPLRWDMVTAFINYANPPSRATSTEHSIGQHKEDSTREDGSRSSSGGSLYDEASMWRFVESAVREGQGTAVVERPGGCSLRNGVAVDTAEFLST